MLRNATLSSTGAGSLFAAHASANAIPAAITSLQQR
jgi:hypothetical protein